MPSVYSYLFILVWTSALAQAQSDVYEIARKGTATEAKEVLKSNPTAFSEKNVAGFTPLILACYHNNNDVAELLIQHRVNVNENSGMGTALMAAVVKGNEKLVELLLQNGANPDLADANGTTALIYAVKFQNIGITKLLLAHNADKAILDNDEKTAFEYAAFSGNESIIQLLK